MDINNLMFAAAVIMLATALAVGIAQRLELGSIVALLAVGIVLGPHSPTPLFSGHVEEMQAVGEIGVMLLLFAIGLDLQPAKLWSMRRLVFGLGMAQYVLTTAVLVAFFAAIRGITSVHWKSALAASLALALSSAAIPLPIVQKRGETTTKQGRAALAIDIFQGFMVIPVLALIPLLGSGVHQDRHPLDIATATGVVMAFIGVFVLGRYVVPAALAATARKLGPSGFVVIVLGAVLFAAWWMETTGISMALGAFMMGVLLSTTVFADQIQASVTPAKRLLLAIFFIAIGMAIDLKQVFALRTELILYLPILLLLKFATLFVLAYLWNFGSRAAVLTGLLMMPFDEVAFVIFASANANGLLTSRDYTVGITVISFSFVVSPVLINLGYRLVDRWKTREASPPLSAGIAPGAVIVAGYDSIGRAICAMLERANIPYTAFDLGTESLSIAKRAKHNVHYADLTNPQVLEAVAIVCARLVIVTMSAFSATKRLISNVRQFYPGVPVMIAVQFLAQRDEARRMGALDVVALAPEGTLSFGRTVLERLGVASVEIEAVIGSLKSNDYAPFRIDDDAPVTSDEESPLNP